MFRSSSLSLLIPLMAIAMRVSSSQAADLSYLLVACYALLGRAQTIQALALSCLFTMLNPVLVPDAASASVGRYVVIFAAVISVAWRSANGSAIVVNKLNLLTICLGVLILLHSLFFSAVVDVSVLKSLSWIVVVLTLLSAWGGLVASQRIKLFNQLQAGLIWLMLLSLPLLSVPSVSYFLNGTGFQGMLNHPQAFGSTVALTGALVGGRMLCERRPPWLDFALFGLCLVLVVMSEARTAGIAMILGLLVAALLLPTIAGESRRQVMPGLRSWRFQLVALAAIIGIMVTGPDLAARLSDYLFKRSDATSLAAAADASRGALVERMILNIREKPWIGIGFGIASEPAHMEVERDQYLGLPLSSSVEKGVMPIAIVEELGILGALAVFGWLLVILRRGARASAPQFAVLVTLLLVNLGESMLFSVGGLGTLLLILLTGSVVTGNDRTTERLTNV